jgi:hypothetical protein
MSERVMGQPACVWFEDYNEYHPWRVRGIE